MIRLYREDDATEVGRLIAGTFSVFNLGFATPEGRNDLLGPFQFAESTEPAHRAAIAQALEAPLVLVAEHDGSIVGGPARRSRGSARTHRAAEPLR